MVIKRPLTLVEILAIGLINRVCADEVPFAYQKIALENGLPAPLFYAVALTESGQSDLSQNQFRPWPWTLNVSGQGLYFPSRKAAWLALQRALDSDERSVDIGLMQVNWRYHQKELGSAWHALDPYHNLRVGAAILRQCYRTEADWWASLGCYHAPGNPVKAARYRERVKRHWRQLTEERSH
jgi:hypothetical protein